MIGFLEWACCYCYVASLFQGSCDKQLARDLHSFSITSTDVIDNIDLVEMGDNNRAESTL